MNANLLDVGRVFPYVQLEIDHHAGLQASHRGGIVHGEGHHHGIHVAGDSLTGDFDRKMLAVGAKD